MFGFMFGFVVAVLFCCVWLVMFGFVVVWLVAFGLAIWCFGSL